MREDLRELLESAEEDLKLAKVSLRLGYYKHACFLSQQAVEKFLKAYLLYKINKYPFIHDITKLINLCKNLEEDFELLLRINADKLDKYYIGTRYPPLLKVTKENAKEAVEIADKVRDFVLKKLGIH